MDEKLCVTLNPLCPSTMYNNVLLEGYTKGGIIKILFAWFKSISVIYYIPKRIRCYSYPNMNP